LSLAVLLFDCSIVLCTRSRALRFHSCNCSEFCKDELLLNCIGEHLLQYRLSSMYSYTCVAFSVVWLAALIDCVHLAFQICACRAGLAIAASVSRSFRSDSGNCIPQRVWM